MWELFGSAEPVNNSWDVHLSPTGDSQWIFSISASICNVIPKLPTNPLALLLLLLELLILEKQKQNLNPNTRKAQKRFDTYPHFT
jgi:hypothetical protein